jgi:hypothetical protein
MKTKICLIAICNAMLIGVSCSKDTVPDVSEETVDPAYNAVVLSPQQLRANLESFFEIGDLEIVPCEARQIVSRLNNEPAVIRKLDVFQIKEVDITIEAESIDIFAVELKNKIDGVSEYLVSTTYIPDAYREEGKEVTVSGDVSSCRLMFSAPNIRTAPINIFELTSIK